MVSPHRNSPQKGADEPRFCIDFFLLNDFIQQECRLIIYPTEVVTSIPQEELTFLHANLTPNAVTGKLDVLLNHFYLPASLHQLVDMCVIKLHLELTASLNGTTAAWTRSLLSQKKFTKPLMIF